MYMFKKQTLYKCNYHNQNCLYMVEDLGMLTYKSHNYLSSIKISHKWLFSMKWKAKKEALTKK